MFQHSLNVGKVDDIFMGFFSFPNEHARSFLYVNIHFVLLAHASQKNKGSVMEVIGGYMPMYMMVYTRIRIRTSNGIVSCANQYS